MKKNRSRASGSGVSISAAAGPGNGQQPGVADPLPDLQEVATAIAKAVGIVTSYITDTSRADPFQYLPKDRTGRNLKKFIKSFVKSVSKYESDQAEECRRMLYAVHAKPYVDHVTRFLAWYPQQSQHVSSRHQVAAFPWAWITTILFDRDGLFWGASVEKKDQPTLATVDEMVKKRREPARDAWDLVGKVVGYSGKRFRELGEIEPALEKFRRKP